MPLAPPNRAAFAETDPVALALLRRGLVAPGLLADRQRIKERGTPAPVAAGVRALEADALALGYLIGPRLHAYLSRQQAPRLATLGHGLLAALASLVGAHVPHLPLFKNFPARVPASTDDLFVQRMFAYLLQFNELSCVLCGKQGTVRPVSPCGHLVCVTCWDLDHYTGCPICHRRIDEADAHLDAATWRPSGIVPHDQALDPTAAPRRAVRLELVEYLDDEVYAAVSAMLCRRTPLREQELAELDAMLDFTGHRDLAWLPDVIEVRETRAHVLHRLLTDPALADRLPQLLDRHATTATDLLRLLHLHSGGDAGLRRPPARRASLPRRLRRLVLARLNTLPTVALLDDLHRHRDAWLRMAENLHPFEEPARHPDAAMAFAALRGTVPTPGSPLDAVLAATAGRHAGLVHRHRGRVRYRTWRSQVEIALRDGNDEHAVALLAQRPGELMRRVAMLAHRHRGDTTEFLLTVAEAAEKAAPGVVLAALGAVRAATQPARPRLFFPAGAAARLWTTADTRRRLPADLGGELEQLLVEEMLRRAAALPRVETALLDTGLTDVLAPFAARTASTALLDLPRGSTQPLPDGDVVRLFLHWTEPEGVRVDLDLSVAMYDVHGEFAGLCDFTRLRFGDRAAVHSGDLTSAPAPLGASEFVDLDVSRLLGAGVRYLVMVVFSYNDIAFEQMTDAFAGVMANPPGGSLGRRGPFAAGGDPFQPQRVEQRFDLTGADRVATPLVVDLYERRTRWLDAKLTASGSGHQVGGYSVQLGRLAVAADRYFGAGFRVSMWELACWHAAARADRVLVRDGVVRGYERQPYERAVDFAARLVHAGPAEHDETAQSAPAAFAALLHGDAELTDAARVYALYHGGLDAARVDRLAAADLVAQLAPMSKTGG
ncbi:MXAN_6230/SCO0854 family RING domain-containing protein [Catellatospora sp. NPDC049111]|uniref:MXAN_6230/SCO0854 family RING domain-containing protein n=1 Tax=Catellatospora sp. NPDC049111 TaxID=3155271 RepID=UPI0033F2CEB0